ncbi:MAG: hypothetical protein Q9182_000308 [Xanthomendoza sp. 2 TL-2023]
MVNTTSPVNPEFGQLRIADYFLFRSIREPDTPAESDLVIFYLHGGGYLTGQPGHYLLFLLRLAEYVLAQDISVSIFTLDYSLAPESSYPTQLAESAAAYAYLVNEKQIPPGKILLAGDSAGGHLALSLLVHLQNPNPLVLGRETSQPNSPPKPGAGLLLLSPWLSLHHQSKSYVTNAHTDILTGPFLHECAQRFLRGHLESFNDPETFDPNSPYLEFLHPSPATDWEAVLPSRIWVFAGADEIFADAITQWVESVKKSKKSTTNIEFQLGPGREHDWQWVETQLNETAKKKFLNGQVGDGILEFGETAKIGEYIVQKLRDGVVL